MSEHKDRAVVTIAFPKWNQVTTRSGDSLSEALFWSVTASCDLGAWFNTIWLAKALVDGDDVNELMVPDDPEVSAACDALVAAARNYLATRDRQILKICGGGSEQ